MQAGRQLRGGDTAREPETRARLTLARSEPALPATWQGRWHLGPPGLRRRLHSVWWPHLGLFDTAWLQEGSGSPNIGKDRDIGNN